MFFILCDKRLRTVTIVTLRHCDLPLHADLEQAAGTSALQLSTPAGGQLYAGRKGAIGAVLVCIRAVLQYCHGDWPIATKHLDERTVFHPTLRRGDIVRTAAVIADRHVKNKNPYYDEYKQLRQSNPDGALVPLLRIPGDAYHNKEPHNPEDTEGADPWPFCEKVKEGRRLQQKLVSSGLGKECATWRRFDLNFRREMGKLPHTDEVRSILGPLLNGTP
jgi:hypothetical protein